MLYHVILHALSAAAAAEVRAATAQDEKDTTKRLKTS
jgi:hypothetical protein